MLEFENIGKFRLHDGARTAILRHLSLTAVAGCITAVLGPSGGGKTTLIRLANRLEDPDEGVIRLRGEDIRSLDPLALRRRVGLVSQSPCMFAGSVLENIQKPFVLRREAAPPADAPQLRDLLQICQLPSEILARDARKLSPGQQQRVSLARTLANDPEVLLLDEPTSALDRPTADRLTATLRDITRLRRLTVILVTHDLRAAERTADRLAFLDQGRILEEGPIGALLGSPNHDRLRQFVQETPLAEDRA